MRIHELVNEDLDEGLGKLLGTAALAAGVGLAGYHARDHLLAPPPTHQTAEPAVPQATIDHAVQLLANPSAKVLKAAAESAGIKGQELAQFLAQCAHETHNWKSLVEYGGSLDFRKYDIKYNPAKAKRLGNTHPGDGALYKGRGFIQITGKYNYAQAQKALNLPLVKHPEIVERPDVAAKVAVWFWKHRVGPNVDDFNDVESSTYYINKGLKGLDDRKVKYDGIKHVIVDQPASQVANAR